MKITVEVDIYNSPDFCEDRESYNGKKCVFLLFKMFKIPLCSLFNKNVQREESFIANSVKCDQCKTEYQSNKDN